MYFLGGGLPMGGLLPFLKQEEKIMAEIRLNIYKQNNKNEIEKTYIANGYDLMLGTVEDFINIIDVDKLNDQKAVIQMVINGYNQIKPLLKDVFPEITDDEFKRVKVKELALTIVQIGTAAIESFDILKQGN
jgi:DNA replicative helicase MCM subunit Mcm2 (Cdc46/Mcm family)